MRHARTHLRHSTTGYRTRFIVQRRTSSRGHILCNEMAVVVVRHIVIGRIIPLSGRNDIGWCWRTLIGSRAVQLLAFYGRNGVLEKLGRIAIRIKSYRNQKVCRGKNNITCDKRSFF